jgi:hypothetical protein
MSGRDIIVIGGSAGAFGPMIADIAVIAHGLACEEPAPPPIRGAQLAKVILVEDERIVGPRRTTRPPSPIWLVSQKPMWSVYRRTQGSEALRPACL